jgi:rhodanese-related sulfurtransferase
VMKYCLITAWAVISAFFMVWCTTVSAGNVNITADKPYVEIKHQGEIIKIQRIQDEKNVIDGGFAKTSRKCPPFCIQPMHVAPGVTTIGELELLDFIETKLADGTGVLIDARTPRWHQKGTIPGSINIPFTTFDLATSDPKLVEAMKTLGVTRRKYTGGILYDLWINVKDVTGIEKRNTSPWDFSHAKELALWCNGMWCGQSPRAIKALLKLNYPPEKIRYYRGGMQSWQILGLSVVVPGTTNIVSR